MAEQPSLDGLARKTRRKRTVAERIPAKKHAIARVILDVQAAHLGRTFDYLIAQDQDESAQPGAFVRVRFGAQKLIGVIWSRSSHTDTPASALRFIERVLPSDVLLSKSLRDDIDAIAAAYGGTSANILRLAVPQRVARVEHETVFDNIRLHRRKDWCRKLKQRLLENNNAQSAYATTARMLNSYSNADMLYSALNRPVAYDTFDDSYDIADDNHDVAQSFVVDALPGSQRLAQDLAWMIVTAISAGRQAVAVLPTLREVNDVMRALMAYGLQPYKRVADNHPGFSAGGFDGDVARLSAADAPADRYRAWRAVAAGIVPCVLGTRAAMYAPVEGDALFAIVEDTAYQYADGMMPYAQARGVMRLRAQRHGGIFVAMAYSRSALSQSEVDCYASNTEVAQLVSGASIPVAPLQAVRETLVPWVRWLNRATLSALADQSIGARIPHTAVRAINDALSEGCPVLFSIPQDGVTQSAVCASCNTQARCKRCTGPLDISSGKSSARCLWCGASSVSWSCSHCGSHTMRAIRVGAAGTAEELTKLFRNVPLVLSSPHQPHGIVECINEQPIIVVATPGAEPRVRAHEEGKCGEYRVVAILDTWVSLYATGLDARVDTLTAWMKAASLCAPRSRGGSVLLIGETYQNLASALTLWDTTQLSRNELLERKQTVLPPAVSAACVWGSRDAVMQALHDIGAMVQLDDDSCSNQSENQNANQENQNANQIICSNKNLPMLTMKMDVLAETDKIAETDEANESSQEHNVEQTIPPLLGIVPMHPPVTDHFQHFENFDDRVKAVVRVPLSFRQELVIRLQREVAHHVATRAAGELRFCIDPKDLLAY